MNTNRNSSRMLPWIGGFAIAAVCAVTTGGAQEKEQMEPYKDRTQPVEKRVDDLLPRMTLEEKIRLLAGDVMDTYPNERLGIPALSMADGPHGVRHGNSTCFPTGVTMASTWDPALIERVGAAMAREMLAKGRNVLLGPCININRVPHGGRNFESFSEDPYLAARMAVGYVKGVQGQGVVATPKHFAANNQEWERTTIDVRVDERTLREIYLPAFEAVVKEGGAWAIMASYNRLNGPYACANHHLLTDILKEEWGFKGIAMSDWGAVHGTVDTANAGLDLEMPHGDFFGPTLLEAVKKGEVTEATIDDKVRRILRVMFTFGLFDGPRPVDKDAVECAAHRALAREVAAAGIVLLKNDGGLLPLDRSKIKSIAVIGPNADVARLGGGGSSEVVSTTSVSPLEGIRAKAGTDVTVRFAPGCQFPGDCPPIESECLRPAEGSTEAHGLTAHYFANRDLSGEPVLTRVDAAVNFDWGSGSPAPEVPDDDFSARWTGKLIPAKSGPHVLAVASDDGSRLCVDGHMVIDNWGEHATKTVTATLTLEAGREYDLLLEYFEAKGSAVVRLGWTPPHEDETAPAVQAAKESDVAVVFVGLTKQFEGEGMDKQDMDLPGPQAELIAAVRQANPRTVVVLIHGSPVLMESWIEKVPAVLEAWYPGLEGGHAIADVLFGDVNPSGKLPVTLPKRWEDCPAYGNYPGEDGKVDYAEGIFVGYRHFDIKKVEPRFPFGHGLSYSHFDISNVKVTPETVSPGEPVRVTCTVKNVGKRAGAEVVQLYVRDMESSVKRPRMELKGFVKVSLAPGETRDVAFDLDARAFSFYQPEKKQWVTEPGDFDVLVGASSRDIRQTVRLVVK